MIDQQAQAKILACLVTDKSPMEICRASGVARRTLCRKLPAMEAAGLIRRLGSAKRPVYTLVADFSKKKTSPGHEYVQGAAISQNTLPDVSGDSSDQLMEKPTAGENGAALASPDVAVKRRGRSSADPTASKKTKSNAPKVRRKRRTKAEMEAWRASQAAAKTVGKGSPGRRQAAQQPSMAAGERQLSSALESVARKMRGIENRSAKLKVLASLAAATPAPIAAVLREIERDLTRM